MTAKILRVSFFVSAALFFFALFFHSSSELDRDLGMHLLLGRLIWQTHQVPSLNLFSYTYPGHPFLNVHLGQVIFYLVGKSVGLPYLILGNAILMTLTLVAITYSGYKFSGSLPATAIALAIFAPLLLERTEIRPESFSYLFTAIFVIVLSVYIRTGQTSGWRWRWWLLVLPFTELLWVNTHIYFLLGVALTGLAVLAVGNRTKWLVITFLAVVTATAINPLGIIKGAILPVTLLSQSGFPVLENMNLLHYSAQIFDPSLFYFVASFILLLASHLFRRFSWSAWDAWSLTTTSLAFLPLIVVRTIPLLFLVNFIFCCDNLARSKIPLSRYSRYGTLIICFVTLLTLTRTFRLVNSSFYKNLDLPLQFGMQVIEGDKSAVDFVIANHLTGPILNNYNIGVYLDYRLYPQDQVFVDARPEAYPVSFGYEYSQMMQNPKALTATIDRYHINLVIYDHTESNIAFLKNLSHDDRFRLIYLDPRVAVLIKKDQHPDLPSLTSQNFSEQCLDYLDCYQLFRVTAMLGWEDLSQAYINRAYTLNPESMSMLWVFGNHYLQNPQTTELGREMLAKYAWKKIVIF